MKEMHCASCGIEIRWAPVLVDGKVYCCAGCSEGGPCTCDYSRLPDLHVAAALALRQQEPSAGVAPDESALAARGINGQA